MRLATAVTRLSALALAVAFLVLLSPSPASACGISYQDSVSVQDCPSTPPLIASVVLGGAVAATLIVLAVAAFRRGKKSAAEFTNLLRAQLPPLAATGRPLPADNTPPAVKQPVSWNDVSDLLRADLVDHLRRVNPNFDATSTRWSANCTHCASAYELRRRGIDAEALGLPDRYLNRGMLGRPTSDMPNAWGFKYSPASQADIVQQLEAAGPGSRGFVRIVWSRGGAHVFNAENVDGTVHFVDAQSNVVDVTRYFGRGKTFFVRSDTLPTPGSSLDDFVKITS
jgi:hypothetical protein